MGPNPFAYVVLVAFVPLAVWTFGRVRPAIAAAGLALGGSLFLPEVAGFDLELMPRIAKENVTYLSILIGAAVHQSQRLAKARPGRGPEALFLLMILGNIGTMWSNPEPLRDGSALVPGLTSYDVISMSISDGFRYALPFLLGRALFRTQRDLRDLMTVLAGAGLLYSLFILVEMGLSSVFRVFQFGHYVYGVFTSIPEWRYGGLQPVVFMSNPLAVAIFIATSAISAAGIAKAGLRIFGAPARASCLWLVFVLLLCRNVASVVYGTSIVLLIALLRPRRVASVALALAIFACAYPVLRMGGQFPHAELVALAERFDPLRARSLQGRFEEEDQLLEKSRDHLWLGWGEYARIPLEEELGTQSKSIDGFWIIVAGVQGLLGLELRLALILVPVAVVWRRQARVASAPDRALLAGLMAILAIRAVDLLPNGWWTNLPVFLAGALHGLAGSLVPVRGALRSRLLGKAREGDAMGVKRVSPGAAGEPEPGPRP